MAPFATTTRRWFCGGVVALSATLAAPPVWAATDFNGRIGWRAMEAGATEARWQSKPIFLVIKTDWCPACRKYASLFHHPAVVARIKAFVPVLVDADADRAAERAHRPDGTYIPRTMVLSPEGRLYVDIHGPYQSRYFLPPTDAAYLLNFMERGLARSRGTDPAGTQPARRAAPDGDSGGPSFRRAPGGDGGAARSGGPQRHRAPASAPEQAPAPGPAPEAGSAEAEAEPGFVDRVLSILF